MGHYGPGLDTQHQTLEPRHQKCGSRLPFRVRESGALAALFREEIGAIGNFGTVMLPGENVAEGEEQEVAGGRSIRHHC